ncbi:DUF5651 domain-containing protein [Brevibacillus panacihumi]|uniref:DUF5651 domain-containing protein n=1 Tax=Brevibacillus panacihumi TaxID=497735 RepID=UPI003D1E244F
MKPYLNQDQQNQIILMGMGIAVMEKLADQEKFKEARGNLLRARSFAKKALDELGEIVDKKSFTKARKLTKESKVLLKPLTSPEEGEIKIEIPKLLNLHMLAIGNTCSGCTRQDYKKCPTRDLLMDTYCPPAQETKTDCQYRQ